MPCCCVPRARAGRPGGRRSARAGSPSSATRPGGAPTRVRSSRPVCGHLGRSHTRVSAGAPKTRVRPGRGRFGAVSPEHGRVWRQDESGHVHTPLEPVVLAATLALIPILILEAELAEQGERIGQRSTPIKTPRPASRPVTNACLPCDWCSRSRVNPSGVGMRGGLSTSSVSSDARTRQPLQPRSRTRSPRIFPVSCSPMGSREPLSPYLAIRRKDSSGSAARSCETIATGFPTGTRNGSWAGCQRSTIGLDE